PLCFYLHTHSWLTTVIREYTYFAFFCYIAPTTTQIYTLSLHDALPIYPSYEERSAGGDLPQISGGGKADRQYVSKRCRLCNDERQRTDSIRFRPKRKTGGTSL